MKFPNSIKTPDGELRIELKCNLSKLSKPDHLQKIKSMIRSIRKQVEYFLLISETIGHNDDYYSELEIRKPGQDTIIIPLSSDEPVIMKRDKEKKTSLAREEVTLTEIDQKMIENAKEKNQEIIEQLRSRPDEDKIGNVFQEA